MTAGPPAPASATPAPAPAQDPDERGAVVPPSREDPFVAAVSTLVGGPIGQHAAVGRNRWWTPFRVLLALAVLASLLGYAEKSTCRVHPWVHDYQYSRVCYSDVLALYYNEDLYRGAIPYLDHPVEYPVIIGGIMEAVAETVRVFPVADRAARYFDLTALLLSVSTVVAVGATALVSGRRRSWDAALLALAPALVLNLDVNWDMVAVAFTALAIHAWSRRRPGLAGLWLGLGVATKFYPLLLLAPLLLLCLRTSTMRSWWRALGATVAAWVVVDVPIWIVAPSGFGRFYAFSEERGADINTLWYAIEYFSGRTFDVVTAKVPVVLNSLGELSFGVLFVLIAWLALRAPHRPRLAQLGFLTLAAFLLTNKVYSPQYVLWILPFAVLARPRWRYFLFWQATEVIELVFVYLFLIHYTDPPAGITYPWLFAAVVLRDAALAGLAALVVREVLHPELDAVRTTGYDDPAGGVFDGAPDRPVWRWAGPRGAPRRQRVPAAGSPVPAIPGS